MNVSTEHAAVQVTPRAVRPTEAQTSPASLRLTYAITPPNQTTALERRQAIAAAQSARIAALPIDALLVYDLQDEAMRNHAVRTFPFMPKVDALDYAYSALNVDLPRIVYRALAGQDATALGSWVSRLNELGGSAVFVGAPSRDSRAPLTVPQAFSVCREQAPKLAFGGVVIAERHQKSGDEHERVRAKVQQGASFFVSQTMWSASATKALLRDLKFEADRLERPLPGLLLTLSPCGSEQTLLFQEWLGVDVPPLIQRELRTSKDMLRRSVELALDVFADVQTFAAQLGIAVGCNVESVSSRAVEVEASVELVARIARYQDEQALACWRVANPL